MIWMCIISKTLSIFRVIFDLCFCCEPDRREWFYSEKGSHFTGKPQQNQSHFRTLLLLLLCSFLLQ